MKMKSIRHIFKELADGDCGDVLRAKALVQTEEGGFRFDLASRRVASEPFEKNIEHSRLVVIGRELIEDRIRELTTRGD